ncbi:MAG: hypothetical protein ACRD82_08645 [Blastocatellia bacterium]
MKNHSPLNARAARSFSTLKKIALAGFVAALLGGQTLSGRRTRQKSPALKRKTQEEA